MKVKSDNTHQKSKITKSPLILSPRQNSNPTSLGAVSDASIWEKAAALVSQSAAEKLYDPMNDQIITDRDKSYIQLVTFLRVGIPSVLSGVVATLVFPFLALTLASVMNDAGVFAVLSQDSSQFVQNFLTVSSLLFSILVGQTYYFMYQQQEAVYYSLFNEVTEAKSLLEQVALVCQGRSMYKPMLGFIEKYVRDDLKQLQGDPAVLLSARPVDDPLESIMYMTSVGVPSIVYETVRSLRQARAARLGALQRKLPLVHMLLLWILAGIELVSFPLLGAGTQTIGGYNILTVEGVIFGIMTFGIVMTLRVVGELWRPAGGAYNVDGVLSVMVSGLEEELQARMSGKLYSGNRNYPIPNVPIAMKEKEDGQETLPMLQQGGISDSAILIPAKKVASWVGKKLKRRLRMRASNK
eukprot:CAMPEP_0195530844 /NCGR_PEP_ID=MMETSP0794_2-20130614/33924_1 /TAXON_ID=515487 /ORGANISM="Stephanopyxis turris, Strain CCMP 815" /LENGTH=410 /DNA_ID=CAMNT_0040662443 /DNA_START=163 /DNA_END=1395 /DNA_ORIENTATION=+